MGEYLQNIIKTDLQIVQKKCSFMDMSRDENEKNIDSDLIHPSLVQSSSSGSLPSNPESETWSGLIGLLIKGNIDMVASDLTTILEHEEVIDFVSPNYYQNGYAIIFRKPVVLFKQRFLLWFLEKYSPFSARNNLVKYNEPIRVFDLRESFWFAKTSFTPLGGGDPPKNISGQIQSSTY
ncbi:GRIN [Lepeophtheirus salmonis]|uniref:GRIN n=1 Tax=Lepeophtheirus salmonis TaxID=72036 RepID=A0A7R8CGW8_LEPSM|nr:GRIN [Lepeophtheirus salmonis]CAF2818936.1 GRIN [Lepeophtheirus salmonis]